MEAFTNLMSPGVASVVTAVIAVSSVSINLYGGLLTERKRADLAKQVERERQAAVQIKEMRSLVARYRGPLLEAAVDLESRLVAVATGRTARGGGRGVVEEEVVYTLFTIAQFLGFVELVRREGPRERSFLQQGNPQGTDTLANLLEGFRFIMCAHPSALQTWYDEGDHRDHPGARSRPGVPYGNIARSPQAAAAAAAAAEGNGAATVAKAAAGDAAGGGESSGSGSQLGSGPEALSAPGERTGPGSSSNGTSSNTGCSWNGAARHYTLSYSDFYRRFYTDESFAAWLLPMFHDLQLLVDTIDLLDPFMVRTNEQHRWRLAHIRYAPLPNAESYKERLRVLESIVDMAMPSMNSLFLRVGWARSARDGHSNEYLGSNEKINEKLYYVYPGSAATSSTSASGGRGRGASSDSAAVAGTDPLVRDAYERGLAGLPYSSVDEGDGVITGMSYYTGGGVSGSGWRPATAGLYTSGRGGAASGGGGGSSGGWQAPLPTSAPVQNGGWQAAAPSTTGSTAAVGAAGPSLPSPSQTPYIPPPNVLVEASQLPLQQRQQKALLVQGEGGTAAAVTAAGSQTTEGAWSRQRGEGDDPHAGWGDP
ncbi:hypothetical protein VOLCADRAFT_94688 [Volvox carteri f. nagariensis]|uniref:Uncharacterized protein n=1 Tax=Volvox carteri f. nagariensis TaxID=3068 RepID=D8U5G8_VOLCA|nr:uncharacterized protein VOLCADRAFT_94688 [Volvox carteri f. nagariensis]EFJ44999.1 hypothetical protein VOLCADRAFT_94688 [Volvox carteri f. nagariensis]|eukprot:XP_002953970.1 hypothetical protein VOLCADRAFT_94688 [Volvox carteri f. nagariensis]